MDKEKKLNYLRKEIIKEVCIDEWKDAWFYPEQDGVRGWLGTQNIMFVGSNPSYNIFPSKFTNFFYDQLKKNKFENAHLTDLVKIRAKNKDADRIINKHFKKQIKFFEEEIKIINPKIIVIMGGRAQESLKKLDYNLKDSYPIYHYSSIRFPKNKKKFIKQLGHIKNINELVLYIQKLNDFRIYNSTTFKKEFFYHDHMGAIIIDSILQAGMKWDIVVKPKLKEIVRYKKAETTTGFYSLYNQKGLENLINFKKGARKIKTIKNVIKLFIKEKIETPVNLKKWLQLNKNIKKFIIINGIGPKTVDYFKILSGIPNCAVDRHIINFLRKAKIRLKNYEEAREIINKTADYLKINRSLLDYSIWKYMSSHNKKCGKI